MDDITPFDWQRLLIGDAPPLFLLEILFRTLVILLWTGALLRWIGGRSISQLSIVEFLLVIALGSAVGDAMFYPEVPLLHAMLVILTVVLVDKGIDIAIRRWTRVKDVVDGKPIEVMRDGVVHSDGMMARQIGTAELFEMLRMKKVENLGQVRLAYLEASGVVSLFAADPPRPGLSIVPPPDITDLPRPGPDDPPCCANCGLILSAPAESCPECGSRRWTVATACEPL